MSSVQSSSHKRSFLSPKDVASELGVTVRTVYNWIHSKEISARKIGGLWRIPRSVLHDAGGGTPSSE